MNWHIAKIVFRISSENTDHKPQFDEQLRLISAENAEGAFYKARALGLQEEETFPNDKLNLVRWEFINVSEVIPVSGLADGCELYSNITETEEASSYIHAVHQKAIFIRLNNGFAG